MSDFAQNETIETAIPEIPKHHKISTTVLHQYQEQVEITSSCFPLRSAFLYELGTIDDQLLAP